ncbi:MAG: SGNH/GDSL hydrolase family protein [Clostridia bacterium]|nr:SGNH/GDSL hydrolase family protein [Clostridia bacterium]
MKKLEIYGDSILRGVTYSAETGRYELYSRDRFADLRESGIETENNSRMGATIDRGLTMLKRKLGEDADGTVVVFEYGGNDCDYKWADVSENPDGDFLPNTPEDVYTETYREAISYARSCGATPVIASLVPIDAEKYMRWISRNLSYENILRWLGDVSMLSRWQEYYSRTAERLAYETGAPLLDLRSTFLLSHDYKSLLCDDGIHPTARGHAMIDAAIAKFVKKIG